MKNKKVEQFRKKCETLKNERVSDLKKQFKEKLKLIDTINFKTFSSENPYSGDVKNKIFFTYSDHYRGNSPTEQWVNRFALHPHIAPDDRGYIKGVCTDLDGFMKINNALSITHNFNIIWDLYFPKFRKSKFSENYKYQCMQIIRSAQEELDKLKDSLIQDINNKFKQLTGCSLGFYIKKIGYDR
jgi:hypothetical protein